MPNFIAGQLNFGGAGPYNATEPGGIARSRDNAYQIWDVFAWQWGRHSFKFGAEFDEQQYVRYEDADALGSLTFVSGYTNATAAAPKAGDNSGSALVSALLGLPQTAVRTLGANRIDGRQQNYAVFAQDDFRLTPTRRSTWVCERSDVRNRSEPASSETDSARVETELLTSRCITAFWAAAVHRASPAGSF